MDVATLLVEHMTADKDLKAHVTYVEDRPFNDFRYAIDASRTTRELCWSPRESFMSGMARTVDWYFDNVAWCTRVSSGAYRRERLGLGSAT